MAVRYLELAAMATEAVPGLAVEEGTSFTFHGVGDYDAALLKVEGGRILLARAPRSGAAAAAQLAEARALAAMTAGVRSRLPFRVPMLVGSFREGPRQLAVMEFIPGGLVERDHLEPNTALTSDIGRSIAAIHALPREFASEAGLPVMSATDARSAVATLVERIKGTGRLPTTLDLRWHDAIDDPTLWQFQPCVVHGALTLDSLVTNGVAIVGVLGWSDLRVGDPAVDLHVLTSLNADVMTNILDEYTKAIGATVDRQLRQRAQLYAELELGRWLLHGVHVDDEHIIADGEGMLDSLVERIHKSQSKPLVHETLPVLDLAGVQSLLRESRHLRGAATAHGPGLSPVHTGMVHDSRAAHPDDNAQDDLDHAEADDLSDDTPPADFLR